MVMMVRGGVGPGAWTCTLLSESWPAMWPSPLPSSHHPLASSDARPTGLGYPFFLHLKLLSGVLLQHHKVDWCAPLAHSPHRAASWGHLCHLSWWSVENLETRFQAQAYTQDHMSTHQCVQDQGQVPLVPVVLLHSEPPCSRALCSSPEPEALGTRPAQPHLSCLP